MKTIKQLGWIFFLALVMSSCSDKPQNLDASKKVHDQEHSSQTFEPPLLIENAWVRSTTAGQNATGAYMKITAMVDGKIVGVRSDAAAMAELHEMRVDSSDVMRMRKLPDLVFTKGQTVEFSPGGYHVMLMGLKTPLEDGTPITLVFQFENANAQIEEVPVQLTAAMQVKTP